MHSNVHISSSTTLPRRLERRSGTSVFNQLSLENSGTAPKSGILETYPDCESLGAGCVGLGLPCAKATAAAKKAVMPTSRRFIIDLRRIASVCMKPARDYTGI